MKQKTSIKEQFNRAMDILGLIISVLIMGIIFSLAVLFVVDKTYNTSLYLTIGLLSWLFYTFSIIVIPIWNLYPKD